MKELAALYFPRSSAKSASTQIKRWLLYNKPLMEALRTTGYVSGQRVLTPKQVGLIFNYLGEP